MSRKLTEYQFIVHTADGRVVYPSYWAGTSQAAMDDVHADYPGATIYSREKQSVVLKILNWGRNKGGESDS